MAKRILKDKLVSRSEIKEELHLIEGTDFEYITTQGNVYKMHHNGLFLKRKIYYNKHNGYMYVTIFMYEGQRKSFRLHRLVAKTFIPNPCGYNVVGHHNNIKTDNRVDNLYWTTISENTQKAVNDGLMVNKKGYEDNQSFPVVVYNLEGDLLHRFGSISLCAKALGLSKGTITRQCKLLTTTTPRKGYIFRYDK